MSELSVDEKKKVYEEQVEPLLIQAMGILSEADIAFVSFAWPDGNTIFSAAQSYKDDSVPDDALKAMFCINPDFFSKFVEKTFEDVAQKAKEASDV